MNGCYFQQVLRQYLNQFLSQHWKTLSLRGGFTLKPTERAQVLLKNGTTAFQNSPPFKRSICFYETTSGNFERFQYFPCRHTSSFQRRHVRNDVVCLYGVNFEINFLENENLFKKNWSTVFQLKILTLKTYYFHTKLSYQIWSGKGEVVSCFVLIIMFWSVHINFQYKLNSHTSLFIEVFYLFSSIVPLNFPHLQFHCFFL